MAGRRRGTTRTDVARLAGVSTAVVSYVVNDGPRGVSTETREKVLGAIRQLNYRPNPSARALKTGSTGSIGVIVSDITNPHYAEFVEAIDSAAGVVGLSLMLGISHGDPEGEASLVTSLLGRGTDGLVLVNCRLPDERLSMLGATDGPCVLMDRSLPGSMLPTVGVDLQEGARLALEHLAGHGHQRIAYVTGPLMDNQIDHRSIAYDSVMGGHGLQRLDPIVAEWSRDGGYRAATDFLSWEDPPTAVFAGSDLIAIGILNAARDHGRSVPDDLAVIGLDGTMESAYVTPTLTTVRQPLDLMARAAIELLTPSDGEPSRPTFAVELIVRESCGHHG